MTPTDPGTPQLPPAPRQGGWYLPYLFLGLTGLYLLSVFGRMSPPTEPYNLRAFATLPVVEGGRTKPIDSAARVYLRMISGREEFVDEAGDKQPAIRWYIDVLAGGSPEVRGPAWKYKVFRIDNEQVLAELGLKPVEGLRYSLEEFGAKWEVLASKSAAADAKRRRGQPLDLFETKILELANRVQLVVNLNRFKGLDYRDNKLLLLPPQSAGEDWKSLGEYREEAFRDGIVAAMTAAQAKLKAGTPPRIDHLTAEDVRKVVQKLDGFDIDTMKPEQKAETVKTMTTMLRADPRTIPEEGRRDWLTAALELLTDDERKDVRGLLETETQAHLTSNPVAVAWEKMVTAYRQKKPDEFNKLVADYHTAYLHQVPGKELARVRVETTYDRFAPFYQCTGLYVLVFVLSVLGFVMKGAEKPQWASALRRSATLVLCLTLVVHSVALLTRMYLMDRWFVMVTNLYSSAIFIGWGCVALGLVLEWLYPIGIGNALAAILGLATTIVAHNLATEDTLEMMQAVLDTNFWLATHVTTVTLGYTATFVAGFLGVAYVYHLLATVVRDSFTTPGPQTPDGMVMFGVAVLGLVTVPLLLVWPLTSALAKFEYLHSSLPTILLFLMGAAGAVYAVALLVQRASVEGVDAHGNPVAGTVPGVARPVAGLALTPELGKILGQMTYGVLCFATLLSFVGTVLGGIWADQSWGRFWGWDPKENGAVLIVLWNSLILHARWCGLVKTRGVAVLAVVGNIITAWSWFGTNQLGIGLHAYGFDTRLADGCTNFWLSMMIIIGLGLIPQPYWASATRRAAVPVAPAGADSPPATPDPAAAVNGHAPPKAAKGKKTGKRR